MWEKLGASPQAIPEIYVCPLRLEGHWLEWLSEKELGQAQDVDVAIGTIKSDMRAGQWPPMTRLSDCPEVAQLQ